MSLLWLRNKVFHNPWGDIKIESLIQWVSRVAWNKFDWHGERVTGHWVAEGGGVYITSEGKGYSLWSLGSHQPLGFIEIRPSVGAINDWLVIASSDEVTFLDIFKSWAHDLQLSYVISWTFQQPFSCAYTHPKGLDKRCSKWSCDESISNTWELVITTNSRASPQPSESVFSGDGVPGFCILTSPSGDFFMLKFESHWFWLLFTG